MQHQRARGGRGMGHDYAAMMQAEVTIAATIPKPIRAFRSVLVLLDQPVHYLPALTISEPMAQSRQEFVRVL